MSRPRSTTATAAKLETHEAVCAERYAGLLQRLGRLELVVWSANGGVWQLPQPTMPSTRYLPRSSAVCA
ncbi:MAG: hypothetical protein EXR12_17635 [Rhodospirillaceae bacterium]|nr:hypothetical protein [Rhodospirillaceae bacterium]